MLTKVQKCGVDGGQLSNASETIHEIPTQIKCSRDTEIHCSEKLSGIRDDAGQSNFRPHGCGICDETFEVEKEFVEHCYYHCCNAPGKDRPTFLELFEIRLLSYFPMTEITD